MVIHQNPQPNITKNPTIPTTAPKSIAGIETAKAELIFDIFLSL